MFTRRIKAESVPLDAENDVLSFSRFVMKYGQRTSNTLPNEQKKCPSLSLFHIRNDKPNSVAKYRSFPRITKLSSLAYGYFSCKYKIFMYRKLAIYGPIS